MKETRDRLHANLENAFGRMLEDISSLVAIPSVLDANAATGEHPFGPRMSDALEVFLGMARSMGFRTRNLDNMVGYAEVGEGPLFGILVHLDVVPPGKLSSWATGAPFTATVREGALYGRGVIDDKGPAVVALHVLKALLDTGVPLRRRFRVIAGLDEESGFRCIERYKLSEEIPEASFSPDAVFPAVNAEKGILQFRLSKKIENLDLCGLPELFDIRGGDALNVVPDELKMFFKNAAPGNLEYHLLPIGASVVNTGRGVIVKVPGRAAHASRPNEGENAIQKFLSVAAQLDFGPPALHAELIKLGALLSGTEGEGLGVRCCDEVSGPLTCNLGSVGWENGVLSAGCDIRYPVSTSGGEIRDAIAHAAGREGWTLKVEQTDPPLYVEEDSDLVRVLLGAYREVTGIETRPVAIGGGTYSRKLPNSVSFGATFPEDERTAHTAAEHVTLESLRKMAEIYAVALARINEFS